MRRKDETLHDSLFEVAREIVSKQGPDALTIRALAEQAGVASGTIYNYYRNKDDILLAITEDYWRRALMELRREIQADAFPEQLREIYAFLRKRINDSAGILMDSLRNVETLGRERMGSLQHELRMAIIQRIRQDKNIPPDIWNDALNEDSFSNFILTNMRILLSMNASHIDPFIEIVKRTLY